MPSFHYTGRKAGQLVSGRLEAPSDGGVASQLANQGIVPIHIEKVKIAQGIDAAFKKTFSFGRVGLYPLIMFCRQMYTLAKAGVPIVYSIGLLRDNLHHPTLKKTLKDIVDQLTAGRSLADCFQRHPKVFSNLFVSLVRVGENTGRLDLAFERLAVYLEREHTTRKNIIGAFRYPIIVMSAILVAMFIVNIWVIPTFADLFKSFHTELPWQTKILIATSDFLVHYGWLVLLVMGGALGLFFQYIKTAPGKYQWDLFKLRIPKVGTVVEHAVLGRFAGAFSLMLKTGVPMIQAIHVLAKTVDNDYIGRKVFAIGTGIERGEGLAKTAASVGIFPPLILQMVRVGEETGSIDELLQEVADHYDREVDYDLKNLSGAIEPTIIAFIAVFVLILAMGVFLPLWELSTVVTK
ncbi:MAG: type II secretion system F family protein [Gammaproteobacteria bacterium]|nr:type II secretion system F family protein [Gammaproteobacteria bacterium]